MSAEVVLSMAGVSKAFGPRKVLCGVDLEVRRGEVICLIGSSGSGKTSLLRCANLLLEPDEGEVVIEGETLFCRRPGDRRAAGPRGADLARIRSKIGMVFQSFNLFPHRTVLGNITEAPMTVRREPRASAERRARDLLSRMGLADFAEKYPNQLSGGQQQRVAIARALAMDPRLMLFDEPTSALDPELVGEVLSAIRGLAQDGMTMMIVTHEMGFAYEVAEQIVFMHEGIIAARGSAQDMLLHPAHPRLAAFVDRFQELARMLGPIAAGRPSRELR
jgi:polar amino acid transport system ATP-binding protein